MKQRVRGLNSKRVKRALNLLTRSPEGIIKLVNLFLCLKHNVVSRAMVRSFLEDWIALGGKTVGDTLDTFERICTTDDKYRALCHADPFSINASVTLLTVMGAGTFHQYILGRPKTKVKSVLPIEPKYTDVASEAAYGAALAMVTSRKAWYNPLATLGKPFPNPRHAWLSNTAQLDMETKADVRIVSQATKVRDALGLIDTKDRTYLLRIAFSARDLHAVNDIKMARPAFADQGNTRFAAYLNKAAEAVYRDNWGVTVHLGKLRTLPRVPLNGLPERICSAIPLAVISGSIDPKPIGWVAGTRGEEVGIDDDIAFIDCLRGRRTLASIRNQIAKVATGS